MWRMSRFQLLNTYHTMAQRPLLDSPKKNRFVGAVLAGKSVQQAVTNHNIRPTTANDIF